MNGLSVLLTLILFLLAHQAAVELRRAGLVPSESSARNQGGVTNTLLAKHSSPRPVTVFFR